MGGKGEDIVEMASNKCQIGGAAYHGKSLDVFGEEARILVS